MRILLGLSGGVDSTYSALKLKAEGHEVEAVVLMMHGGSPISDAEQSAESLGIPLHVIDCKEDFERSVIGNFISEYMSGRTPNPCVICNSEIKFIKLYEYAREHGFDAIATGHYANIVAIDNDGNVIQKTLDFVNKCSQNSSFSDYRYAVSFSADAKKDQTYMLWRLPQEVLAMLVFPLSEAHKGEVKERARDAGLESASREESQEICFVDGDDYAAYIEERMGKCPEGDFIDDEGNVLGRHKGIIRYTKGQRRGLGISASSRIFVTEINPENNTVTVSPNDSFATEVFVSKAVFSGMERPSERISKRLTVKLRYAAARVPCEAVFEPSGDIVLHLDTPVRAVTNGQSAVLYDGDIVAAGGFICSSR